MTGRYEVSQKGHSLQAMRCLVTTQEPHVCGGVSQGVLTNAINRTSMISREVHLPGS